MASDLWSMTEHLVEMVQYWKAPTNVLGQICSQTCRTPVNWGHFITSIHMLANPPESACILPAKQVSMNQYAPGCVQNVLWFALVQTDPTALACIQMDFPIYVIQWLAQGAHMDPLLPNSMWLLPHLPTNTMFLLRLKNHPQIPKLETWRWFSSLLLPYQWPVQLALHWIWGLLLL